MGGALWHGMGTRGCGWWYRDSGRGQAPAKARLTVAVLIGDMATSRGGVKSDAALPGEVLKHVREHIGTAEHELGATVSETRTGRAH